MTRFPGTCFQNAMRRAVSGTPFEGPGGPASVEPCASQESPCLDGLPTHRLTFCLRFLSSHSDSTALVFRAVRFDNESRALWYFRQLSTDRSVSYPARHNAR